MRRRDFIQKIVIASLGASFLKRTVLANKSTNLSSVLKGNIPDLIVAQGKSMPDLFSLSMKAFGGIENFNIKRKRIIIKPTIKWDSIPSNPLNTNPELLTRIIEQCFNAGAGEIYVLDHTIDDWRKCYKNSGIEKASKIAFGKVIPANDHISYREMKLNSATSTFQVHVHELVQTCDLIINVPHLNFNRETTISAGIFNLHGLTWENGVCNSDKRDEYLASILQICKPVLNVIDAAQVILPNGEKQEFNQLIIGADVVATDAYACNLLGINPINIGYLKMAEQMKFGTLNTDHLTIQRIEIEA